MSVLLISYTLSMTYSKTLSKRELVKHKEISFKSDGQNVSSLRTPSSMAGYFRGHGLHVRASPTSRVFLAQNVLRTRVCIGEIELSGNRLNADV